MLLMHRSACRKRDLSLHVDSTFFRYHNTNTSAKLTKLDVDRSCTVSFQTRRKTVIRIGNHSLS